MVSKNWKIDPTRSFTAVKQPAFALIVLLFTTLSCAFEDLTVRPTATFTPAPQTGTDYLSYNVPNYTVTLAPGQSVPGTGLRYINRTGNDYNLTVDNAPLPSTGNTQVFWEGIIRPSVFARYNLQIAPDIETDNLNAFGPVKLVILRPEPTELAGLAPATINGAVHYTGILIGETGSVGRAIAGTSLVYDGERNGAAAFSGTIQPALRPTGSSFIWYGSLLDDVFIKHTLTVTEVMVDSVRLEGTAEIWVIPSR